MKERFNILYLINYIVYHILHIPMSIRLTSWRSASKRRSFSTTRSTRAFSRRSTTICWHYIYPYIYTYIYTYIYIPIYPYIYIYPHHHFKTQPNRNHRAFSYLTILAAVLMFYRSGSPKVQKGKEGAKSHYVMRRTLKSLQTKKTSRSPLDVLLNIGN